MYDSNYHKIDISQTKFLITGGAGFIGSHIVEYLMNHNAGMVRVLDNLLTGNYKNIEAYEGKKNFEFIEGDIVDNRTCLHATEGMDFVLHQAALGSVPRSIKDPARTNSINVSGFLNMLIAANENKVKRFVYASSSSVYGDEKTLPKVEDKVGHPLSPYAVSKTTNELYANVFYKTYGLEIIGLRYFNVFGPRQDPNGPYAAVIPIFIDKSVKGEDVFIDGDGEQTRDFTFVANAVQANIKAVFTQNEKALGRVFNIAYGENYSVNYMFNEIKEQLNASNKALNRPARTGDIKNSLADISSAKSLLEYNPEYNFKNGLVKTIDYFLDK